MSQQNVPVCIKMLRSRLPKLTNSKRKAAEYILENYQDVVKYNVTELAERSGTSLSTIIRLGQDLGFKRYQDFKLSLAQQISNPTQQIHEALEKNDDLELVINKVFKSNSDAISSTLQTIDLEAYHRAVDLIAQAKHLEFYGFGGSSAVAQDAAHKFLKIGIKCAAISDNDLQAMSASLLTKDDVVVAISHTGRNRALLYNLNIARETGASIIVITNYGKSPITKLADVVLYTSSSETAFKSDALSSRIAELTILDSLFVAVSFINYDQSQENITKTRNATVNKKLNK